MTPAEQVAATKRKQRPGKKPNPVKDAVWECTMAKCRADVGLSLRDVSIACKMSVAGLWRIERGGDVMLTTAKTLVTFFGTTIDEMWPVRKEPSNGKG